MRLCGFLFVVANAPPIAAFVLPSTRRLLPPSRDTRYMADTRRDETIEQLQQEIEAALEEREKLRQELQEEVREFQRQFDQVKTDLQNVDSRLDEQIKTFKQTFETEKKYIETKDANIVKKMERLETVQAGGGPGGGLFGGAPLAPLAALSVAAIAARRESLLKEKRKKVQQEAAAKAKLRKQPTSAVVASLAAGIIGMGLISASLTGIIDEVNAPFGLTPWKDTFTIKMSETEQLQELLAKLQVEAPSELNLGANKLPVDTPDDDKLPMSSEKQTGEISEETTKQETATKSEMPTLVDAKKEEPAAKKTETPTPKETEEPKVISKAAKQGEELPTSKKTEASTQKKNEESKVVSKETTQKEEAPAVMKVELPPALVDAKGKEAMPAREVSTLSQRSEEQSDNSVASKQQQQESPVIIKSEPLTEVKGTDITPSGAKEVTTTSAPKIEEQKEMNKLLSVVQALVKDEALTETTIKGDETTVKQAEKTTAPKGEQPLITKKQEAAPLTGLSEPNVQPTTAKQASTLNQIEKQESGIVPEETPLVNEESAADPAEKSTQVVAKEVDRQAFQAARKSVESTTQKQQEKPSEISKALKNAINPAVSNAPEAGLATKAVSDATGSPSRAASDATSSVAKAPSLDASPGASDGTASVVTKGTEDFKVPDASGATASVPKSVGSLSIPDASNLKSSVSKVFENQRVPGASDLAEVVAKSLSNFKLPDTSELRDNVSKALEGLPRNPGALAAAGAILSATVISFLLGMLIRSSSSPDTKPDAKFSAEPNDNGASTRKEDTDKPNGLGSTGKTSPGKSLTPLEKEFALKNAAPEMQSPAKRVDPNVSNDSAPAQRHSAPHSNQHSAFKSMPPLEKKFTSELSQRNGYKPPSTNDTDKSHAKNPARDSHKPATNKSMTPLEKKFGAKAGSSKNNSKQPEAARHNEPEQQAPENSAQSPRNTVEKPRPTKSKTPLEKKFGDEKVPRNTNGSDETASSRHDTAEAASEGNTTVRNSDNPVKSNTPLEKKFVQEQVVNKSDQHAEKERKDLADRGVKAKPMSQGSDKPPLKGKATITKSKRKHIVDAEFVPAPPSGSEKSDPTRKSSAVSNEQPKVLDAVVDDVQGCVNKLSGNDVYSNDTPVVLNDALMESVKEYVKTQAGSTSPVVLDELIDSVKEYVRKQAGSTSRLVLDDALMASLKEYVKQQAGVPSDSTSSSD